MKVYINNSDNTSITIKNLSQKYENTTFYQEGNREKTWHNGRLYSKVAEFTHKEKNVKGFFMRLGAWLAAILTGTIALKSQDIFLAAHGETGRSLYAVESDAMAMNTIVQEINKLSKSNLKTELNSSLYKTYWRNLETTMEIAYIELYFSPLVSLLNREDTKGSVENGRKNLAGIGELLHNMETEKAKEAFLHYTQLKEIETPIKAPMQVEKNSRYQALVKARETYQSLETPEEKEILTHLLLNSDSIDLKKLISEKKLTEEKAKKIVLLKTLIHELSNNFNEGNYLRVRSDALNKAQHSVYNKELTKTIEKAYIELYFSPALVSLLSDVGEADPVKSEQENLILLANTFATFIKYAQLKEIQNPSFVPPFKRDTSTLLDAQKKYRSIKDDEYAKDLLVRKILNSTTVDLKKEVDEGKISSEKAHIIQDVFITIGKLSEEFQRGEVKRRKPEVGPKDLCLAAIQTAQIEIMNKINEASLNYQKKLKEIIQGSVKILYNDDDLVKLLSDDGTSEDGRDNIKELFATEKMANFFQLKELENEISCPKEFGEDLKEFNSRYEALNEARQLLKTLEKDPENKRILTKMLLNPDSVKEDEMKTRNAADAEAIKKLFKKIPDLAGNLYQGPLLGPTRDKAIPFAVFCKEALVEETSEKKA